MPICIYKVTVGQWFENSYLLYNDHEGWLVDPGDDFEILDNAFCNKNIRLKGIINTHAHFDHLGAVSQFKEKYDLPFFVHSLDKRLVGQANLYRKLANGVGIFSTPHIDGFIDQIPSFKLGMQDISVIHTPGHTNGSVTFVIENNLISGDLIFNDTIGRTDLPGGNLPLLKQTVTKILNDFKGFKVFPGHGKEFFITEEYINRITEEIADGD